jgi:hypothetical protein
MQKLKYLNLTLRVVAVGFDVKEMGHALGTVGSADPICPFKRAFSFLLKFTFMAAGSFRHKIHLLNIACQNKRM